MSSFTHNFEIDYDGRSITGQVEFNTDGKVSYVFDNGVSVGLDESTIINQMFSLAQSLYHLGEGLNKIKITKK